MIIIITGASHTGKTALAQRMLELYKYPYLSIDHLKMGLIRSGNTNLTPMSDDKDLTEYLWPIACEMIKTAIENNQNLIVEGCYVPSYWKKDFSEEYLKRIKLYCLVMTECYIKEHIDENTSICSCSFRNSPGDTSQPLCSRVRCGSLQVCQAPQNLQGL